MNIAHSIDAPLMRDILEPVYDAGFAGLQVYDNYIYQANVLVDYVIPGARKGFHKISELKPYASSVEQMRQNRVGSKPQPIELHYGNQEIQNKI